MLLLSCSLTARCFGENGAHLCRWRVMQNKVVNSTLFSRLKFLGISGVKRASVLTFLSFSRLQCPRPITLKKDNIQTRNRKMNKNKMAPLSSPSAATSSPAKRQPEGSSDFISAVVPSSSTSLATVSNTAAAADAISADDDDHAPTVSAASAAAARQFQLTSSAAAAAAAAAAAWLQFPVNHHFNHLPQQQQQHQHQMNGYDTAAAFAPPSNFTSV